MSKSQIVLGMIVRDEADQILTTVNSLPLSIFKYFIHDTGSQDGTMAIIEKFCADREITLVRTESKMDKETFDYSVARNMLLEMIEQDKEATHALLMDANDVLIGGDFLIEWLNNNSQYDGYQVLQKWKSSEEIITFGNIRLISNNGKCRYTQSTHEVISPKSPKNFTQSTVPQDVVIFQDRDMDKNKSKKRFARDAVFLQREYEKDPYNFRAIYYLANSFFFQNDYENAAKWYEKRYQVSIQSNEKENEEVYQSIVRRGKCLLALGESWNEAEKLFWLAWRYFKDAESVLMMARHCVETNDPYTGFHLAKMACDIEVPHNLWKNQVLYDFERWYLLSLFAHSIAEYEKGYSATLRAKKTLEGWKGSIENPLGPEKFATMSSIINSNITSYRNQLLSGFVRFSTKSLVVIFAGWYYSKWNGSAIGQKGGLGGSETSAVSVAEKLVATGKYSVVICCDTQDCVNVRGVDYIRVCDYEAFCRTYIIDALVVLRFSDFIRKPVNIAKVFLWLQDVIHISKGAIPNFELLDGVVVLTEWHARKYLSLFNERTRAIIAPLLRIIGNGVDLARFSIQPPPIRQPYKFIYSSCPSRGLDGVVEYFSRVKQLRPCAELHIFSDFNNGDAKRTIPNIEQFKTQMERVEGVFINDRVDQNTLAAEMLTSSFWLYLPFNFDETYCITALEMQAAGVMCMCCDNGSLKEVVGERGYLFNGSVSSRDVILAMDHLETNREEIQERMQQWIQLQTWQHRTEQWMALIG